MMKRNLFGELRAVMNAPDVDTTHAVSQILHLFDHDAPNHEEEAKEQWIPYIQEHLFHTVRDGDATTTRPWRALLATLKSWDLKKLEHRGVLEMHEKLEQGFHGKCKAFEPCLFDHTLRMAFDQFGSPEVMASMVLNADFLMYLSLAQGRTWTREPENPYAFQIFGAKAMLGSTAYLVELFCENRMPDEDEGAEAMDPIDLFMREITPKRGEDGAGAWVVVGEWSDKHETMLCCDSTDEQVGGVYDFHDAHPWLNGNRSGDLEASSFVDFLGALFKEEP